MEDFGINDLRMTISEKYESLSMSQKSAAEFVINNLLFVATSSALQVANKIGVSDATVIRFTMSLGFNGYVDFQNCIKNALVSERTLLKFKNVISSTDEKNILNKIYDEHKSIIDMTFNTITKQQIDNVVSLILQAEKIYTVGYRSLYGTSHYLGSTLSNLLGNSYVLDLNGGYYYDNMGKITEKDLLIGMSFARYTKLTYELIEIAKMKDAKIVIMTDSLLTPISKFADVHLTVSTDASMPFDSILGITSLIEIILASVAINSKSRVEDNLNRFESSVAKRVFLKESNMD